MHYQLEDPFLYKMMLIPSPRLGLGLIRRHPLLISRLAQPFCIRRAMSSLKPSVQPQPAVRFQSTTKTSSTSEKEPLVQPQEQTTDPEKDPKPKKKGSMKEIAELLRLVKPELGTLSFAMCCLCVSSAVSMLFPSIMGKIIDTAKAGLETATDVTTINILGMDLSMNMFYCSLLSIFALGSLANFGRIVLLKRVGENVMAKLRVDIERQLFYQSSKFWDTYKNGDLISRLVNDSTIVTRSITQNISDGMRSSISGLVGIGMMLTISAKLTGYICLLFPVLMGIAFVFGRRVKKVSKEIQAQLGSLTKVSEEQFSFVKTIQAFNNEQYEVKKFQSEVKKLYDLSIWEGRLNGYFYSANGFIGNTALVVLLSLGVWMVRTGELSIGDLSSYLMYTIYSASSVYSLSNFYSELMKGVGASERVFELLKLKSDIDPNVGKTVDVLQGKGDIQFSNIKFVYPTRQNHTVFEKLNLTINKGDHACLVGPSGCGKSTVAQLLFRHYDPISGDVIINGEKLNELSLSNVRKQIGIVQQEPMLFSGSLRENIAYGKPDASDEEIAKVCKLANCSKFIENFPNGLETVIGSKGAQLSGGQKQRVALARTLLLGSKVSEETRKSLPDSALYGDDDSLLLGPPILILDEATSALDAQSEEAIKKTLKLRDDAGLTTVSIAHRLSTIKMSERVIVFNQRGEIVDDGKFDDMILDASSELNKLLNKEAHEEIEKALDLVEDETVDKQ